MVLMTVGNNKALDFIDIFLKIGYIGNDQSIPSMSSDGSQTAVNHHNAVFILECGNVHADLL